jgi:16S rRNA (uracil1498-N3)-methyltransferase
VTVGVGPGRVGAAAHAFVPTLDKPVLAPEDRHHLERVLRLRRGDLVTVSDGAGGWRPCTFGTALSPAGPIEHEPNPTPPITVAFGVLKGERPELVVQKLTELGVDRVVPMTTARCVVHWEGERARRHTDRLRRISREAAMQARRAWLPEVDQVRLFAEVATWKGAALADGDGDPVSLDRPVVLVGPEGGWAPEETGAGLPTVMLGPHVLRAETAAIVAGALLTARRAGCV